MTTTMDGPAWAQQGLLQRGGRYPLSVEAPVLSMVATLVPGVSTLTQYARYYALYWAVADFAARNDLGPADCQRLLRRAELLLALVSKRANAESRAHGVDAAVRGLEKGMAAWRLADITRVATTYSPRAWGFWSQYGGPSDALGTVAVKDGSLRSSRHLCPTPVVEMFAALLALAGSHEEPELTDDVLDRLGPIALDSHGGPDLAALSELFTATRLGHHDRASWQEGDAIRRAIFRLVARAAVLEPAAPSRLESLRGAVAYGAAATEDPVLQAEAQTLAWRGVLLRHRSVGSWRRLWASLVSHVHEQRIVTRAGLHEWVSSRLPHDAVTAFVGGLPLIVDLEGNPAPAEDQLVEHHDEVAQDLAVLVLGAQRAKSLDGMARVAFLGGRRPGRGTFLDPSWVDRRVSEHAKQSMQALGRTLVDDMLAQAQRVAMRKVQVSAEGTMRIFTRLHERNDVYTAESGEGSGNVGTRVEQVAGLAEQLGLIGPLGSDAVTQFGGQLLDLPS